MEFIEASHGTPLILKKTGTNEVRGYKFNVKAWKDEYPDCVIALYHHRPGDNGETYSQPVENFVLNGDWGYWTIMESDVVRAGFGEAELVMSAGDAKDKSCTFDTKIFRSVSGNEEDPPEPFEGYVNQIMNASENVIAHRPKIGENGHWFVYNAQTEEYVDTGVDAHGIPGTDGYSPEVTVEEIEGGHKVTITDEDHPEGQTFNVMDGHDGEGVVQFVVTVSQQSGTYFADKTNAEIWNAYSEGKSVICQIRLASQSIRVMPLVYTSAFNSNFLAYEENGYGKHLNQVLISYNGSVEVTEIPVISINDSRTSESDTWSSQKISGELDRKVDTELGKGLSSNDYTNEEKAKLAGIDDGANKTIVDSELDGTSENPVQNKVVSESVSSLNQAIVAQSAEIQLRATKAELKEANRRIHLLEEAAVGKLYTQETETETSYQQTVPSGSLSNAVLGGYGGKSVVWNQQFNTMSDRLNYEGIDSTFDSSTRKITIKNLSRTTNYTNGSTRYQLYPQLANHKYYLFADSEKDLTGVGVCDSASTAQTFHAMNSIYTDTVDRNMSLRVTKDYDFVTTHPINDETSFNLYVIDLTQYGADDITSVDDYRIPAIEAYALAHPEYNAGEIVSADVNEIKTVGRNLWDEQTRLGFYNDSGVWTTRNDILSSQNPIPVVGGSTIYIVHSQQMFITEWDASGEFIKRTSLPTQTKTITLETETRSIHFNYVTQYGTAYKNDTAFLYQNGVCVPYVYHTYPIPSSVLSQYPLRSAGSVYDTITYEPITVDGVTVPKWYHTQKTLLKHLGDYTWIAHASLADVYQINKHYMPTKVVPNRGTANMTCKYIPTTSASGGVDAFDMSIALGTGTSDSIYVHDSSAGSVSNFNEIIQGVYGIFERAEPIVTDITDIMEGWNGVLEIEEGGIITFKQEGDTIFAIPNTVNYLVKTTGGA